MTVSHQLPPELVTAAQELAEVRSAKKTLETREAELRSQLISHLLANATNQGFTAAGQVAVTLRTSTRTGINKAKLEALYPDIAEQCKTETSVTTLLLP